MSRLVTFGCSYTFGMGLKDIYKNPTNLPFPSIYSWPNWLGIKLQMEVINKSHPGSGNKEILNKILKFNFQNDDLVIIMWSHFVRFDYYFIHNNKYEGKRVNLEYDKNTDYFWDNAYKNYLAMQHAALYLRAKNVRSLAFIAFKPDYLQYPKPDFLDIPNFFTVEDYVKDKALDDGHFGIESHKCLAEMLYNIIEKNELR